MKLKSPFLAPEEMFPQPKLLGLIGNSIFANGTVRKFLPFCLALPLLIDLLLGVFERSSPIVGTWSLLLLIIGNTVIVSVILWRGAHFELLAKSRDTEAKTIMENIAEAVISIDTTGAIRSLNGAVMKMFGYSRSELMGQNVRILMPEPDRSRHDSYISNYLNTGMGKIMGSGREVQGVTKDGVKFPLELSLSKYIDQSGNLIFVGIVRDITERTRANENLKKWEHLFMHAGWAVAMANPGTNVFTNVNEAFAKMHGYSVDELVGKRIEMLFAPEFHLNIQEVMQAADLLGSTFYETIRLRKDGSKFPALCQLTSYKDLSGNVLFRAVTLQDVSALKHQKILEQQKDAAENASAEKSAFLSNMSHEIRNPLAVILGFCDLLADANLTEAERVNYASTVKRNGEILSNVINDILDIAKVEAGKIDIVKSVVGISEIIDDITALLFPLATSKGLKISTSVDKSVPEYIQTDTCRLRQILVNVIGNAIKFTDNGEISIAVRMSGRDDPNEVEFLVADTGCGLTQEQAEGLFTRFVQASSTTSRRYGGTGLGLILSRKLANLLGGSVSLVQSTPGHGSIFKVTISSDITCGPLVSGAAKSLEVAESETCAPSKNLNGIRILLVEDTPDSQMLLGHILTAAGAYVEAAYDGDSAVKMVESGDYDIILMDLQMPVMDGYTAVRVLRSHNYKKPIIALTAHTMLGDRERCLAAGFDSHIGKPVHRETLTELVSYYSRQVH